MRPDMQVSQSPVAGQNPQASQGTAEKAAPGQDAVDAFQEALQGKGDVQGKAEGVGGEKKFSGSEGAWERGGKADNAAPTGKTDGPEPGQLPSASSLLESLFGGRMQAQGPAEPAGALGAEQPSAAASARTAETADLVNKLVDRILVSEPGKGPAEVRITLSDKALPGTELSLSRAADGQLTVRLSSTDASSFQTLVGAQDSLRASLERQGENVRVEVSRSDGAGAEDGDARRRSRGYDNSPYDEER